MPVKTVRLNYQPGQDQDCGTDLCKAIDGLQIYRLCSLYPDTTHWLAIVRRFQKKAFSRHSLIAVDFLACSSTVQRKKCIADELFSNLASRKAGQCSRASIFVGSGSYHAAVYDGTRWM